MGMAWVDPKLAGAEEPEEVPLECEVQVGLLGRWWVVGGGCTELN